MICNKCKRNLPDDSEFCQYCGNKIEKSEPVGNFDKLPIDYNERCSENVCAQFCHVCGAKLVEGASFCIKCGNSLQKEFYFTSVRNTDNADSRYRSTSTVSGLSNKNKTNLLTIYNFVFDICLAVYAFLAFLSVELARVYVNIYNYSYNSTPKVLSYFYIDDTCVALSAIVGASLLGFGIASFVYGIKEKDSLKIKLSSIFRLVVGILAGIMSIILAVNHA